MYKHILQSHLGAIPLENGRFENTTSTYTCLWDQCRRFASTPATDLSQIATHIKVHLPPRPSVVKDTTEQSGPPPAVDERNDAAGIPLSAVLVLRNLARNLPKTDAEETALKLDGGISWVERLFKAVEPRLFEVLVHNKSLVSYYTQYSKSAIC